MVISAGRNSDVRREMGATSGDSVLISSVTYSDVWVNVYALKTVFSSLRNFRLQPAGIGILSPQVDYVSINQRLPKSKQNVGFVDLGCADLIFLSTSCFTVVQKYVVSYFFHAFFENIMLWGR